MTHSLPKLLSSDLLPHPVRRILVIKLRAIGDVLLSTVVLDNLRMVFPGATIDFLTEPAARDVVSGHSAVDDILILDPKRHSLLSAYRLLRRRRYDLVFDLFCNPRSAQYAFLTRAPVRVGYPFRGRAWAYTIHATTRADQVHNTEFNLDALRAAGIPAESRSVRIAIPPDDAAWADGFVGRIRNGARLVVALNPSGTWVTKRWGLAHFAQLADALQERFHARCILLWGPGEQEDAEAVVRQSSSHPVLMPATTLKQLAAVLARCDAMVSNDTGPMHIAAATGIPVLGIFGPTNPHLQGPYNDRSTWVRAEEIECLGCNLTACPIGIICMQRLDVERVVEAFSTMLHNAAPS